MSEKIDDNEVKNVEESKLLYTQGKLAMNNKDYNTMKKFFNQVIELYKNSSAMNDLAFYHQYIERDVEKVVQYYTMSIDQGNVNACYNLGCFYHEQKDSVNKLRYFTLASERGDVRAHFGLGIYYEEDDNEDQSYKYYVLAANAGLAKAHTAIGDYWLKKGNFIQAKNEYFEALRGGDYDAARRLSCKKITLTSDERKELFSSFSKNWKLETGKINK
jgi:TPR repeat protein